MPFYCRKKTKPKRTSLWGDTHWPRWCLFKSICVHNLECADKPFWDIRWGPLPSFSPTHLTSYMTMWTAMMHQGWQTSNIHNWQVKGCVCQSPDKQPRAEAKERSGKMTYFNWTTEEALKSDLCLPSATVQVDLAEADFIPNVLLEGRDPTPTSQAQGGHSVFS